MSPLNNLHHPGVAAQVLGACGSDVFEPAPRPRLETGCELVSEPGLKNAPAAPYFAQLVRQLSAAKAAAAGPCVVALTSAKRGDGVTFIGRSLAGALLQGTSERVVMVEAETLGTRHCLMEPPDSGFANSQADMVYGVRHTGSSQKKWDARRVARNLEEIGRHFGWVLVDCPPLRESDYALALASHMTGIVFVVAAEKTKRSDIAQARRAIELSSGTILGFVLNKRTWPVPDSLYQRM
jgi:hypothetical protein